MKLMTRIAAIIGTLALLLTPTAALAQGVEYAPAHPAHPAHPTPGPKASLPEKAKAYGVYCRGFPKKHLKGQKGTPFSQCVTAVARVVSSQKTAAKTTPRAACQGFSKEHVAGAKGTPFSRCVVATAQAKQDQSAS